MLVDVLCGILCVSRTWGALYFPQIVFDCMQKHMCDVCYNIENNIRLNTQKLHLFKRDMSQLSNASRITQNG